MNLLSMASDLTAARQRLIEKLKRKKYRDAYVVDHIKTWIAYQIRANREERGLNQTQLGKRAGRKPQNVVSRLEDPDYGKYSIQTLLKIASAFDVALLVKFVPFSRWVREYDDVSPEKLVVKEFDEDDEMLKEWALEEAEAEAARIEKKEGGTAVEYRRIVSQSLPPQDNIHYVKSEVEYRR